MLKYLLSGLLLLGFFVIAPSQNNEVEARRGYYGNYHRYYRPYYRGYNRGYYPRSYRYYSPPHYYRGGYYGRPGVGFYYRF